MPLENINTIVASILEFINGSNGGALSTEKKIRLSVTHIPGMYSISVLTKARLQPPLCLIVPLQTWQAGPSLLEERLTLMAYSFKQ